MTLRPALSQFRLVSLALLSAATMIAAMLPLAAFAAGPITAPKGPVPVAGVDYVVIDGGQAYAPAKGKVEVVEVFGYICPHCATLEPLISTWKSRLPADVVFRPLAAPMGEAWIPYARAFFAAQSLGLADRTHRAMFDALHVDGSLPRNGATAQEIAGFYATRGANARKFLTAMASPAVGAQLQRARDFMIRSGVEGTPSIVVNGRYRVIGGSGYDDMLRITDHLIARERAALRR